MSMETDRSLHLGSIFVYRSIWVTNMASLYAAVTLALAQRQLEDLSTVKGPYAAPHMKIAITPMRLFTVI
jgi:hypothetical protein